MRFQQFTKCVDASNYNGQSEYIQTTVPALLTTFGVTALLVAAAAEPWCYAFLAPIFAAVWILAYCRWWLYGRLICLPDPSAAVCCPGGRDPVVIGLVIEVATPNNSFLHIINPDPTSADTDYGISILPAPNHPGSTEQDRMTIENSMPYGFLMKEQAATHDIGLPFGSKTDTDPQTNQTSWVLHCELEGAGYQDLMLASMVALELAVAALAACLLFPPPAGWIIAIILAILSVLVDYTGIVVGHSDQASPADVNPALGEIHSGDILVIMGTWIYDTGHEGWNELHPVKLCERVGTWTGDWPPNIAMICNGSSTVTIESQQQPQNQWQVHPIIDGCQPVVIV